MKCSTSQFRQLHCHQCKRWDHKQTPILVIKMQLLNIHFLFYGDCFNSLFRFYTQTKSKVYATCHHSPGEEISSLYFSNQDAWVCQNSSPQEKHIAITSFPVANGILMIKVAPLFPHSFRWPPCSIARTGLEYWFTWRGPMFSKGVLFVCPPRSLSHCLERIGGFVFDPDTWWLSSHMPVFFFFFFFLVGPVGVTSSSIPQIVHGDWGRHRGENCTAFPQAGSRCARKRARLADDLRKHSSEEGIKYEGTVFPNAFYFVWKCTFHSIDLHKKTMFPVEEILCHD